MTTVIAKGTTSSMMAAKENSGAVKTGREIIPLSRIPDASLPDAMATMVPTTAATATGGAMLAKRGLMLNATKTMTMGSAMSGSVTLASMRSSPKRRKMPATMAITMVGGSTAMIRPMRPVHPSANTTTPVTRYAPITSAKLKWVSESPTMTVPGIVQKYACGLRYI